MSRSGTSADPWRPPGPLLLVLLILLGSLRIASTYTVFSATYDEPAHLACGLEWLSRGTYRYEPLHPPLARVAAAIGPYLDGLRSTGQPRMWDEGAALLDRGDPERTLLLSRLGVLPFFWIACLVVYRWARRDLDQAGACLAVLIFSFLPPVLAHAGLATTDMALTAMLGAAFLAGLSWCERPDWRSALRFGGALGLALLSKFSALAFLPVAGAAALLCWWLVERPGPAATAAAARVRLPGLGLVLAAAFLTLWAGYRFSFGPLADGAPGLPFPEFFAGLAQVVDHERLGAGSAYLLGAHSDSGWWWYYLVVLGVKTPLALFVLLAAAAVLARRRRLPRGLWLAAAFSGGIFLFCLANRIDLGVRHILPVYLGLSVLAAAAAQALLRGAAAWRPAPWLAGAALLGLVLPSILAHPDYIPYFNPLAGAHPERVLIDSDLDWGQDLKRLARRLRQAQAANVAFAPCMKAEPEVGLPPRVAFDLLNPAPGWNAARLSVLQLALAYKNSVRPDLRFWTETIAPQERIGAGILLWYFPPQATPQPAPGAGTATPGC
jgi:4-amino-4-deoxy-L-arabinose transferase-like glycosyltransferase